MSEIKDLLNRECDANMFFFKFVLNIIHTQCALNEFGSN